MKGTTYRQNNCVAPSVFNTSGFRSKRTLQDRQNRSKLVESPFIISKIKPKRTNIVKTLKQYTELSKKFKEQSTLPLRSIPETKQLTCASPLVEDELKNATMNDFEVIEITGKGAYSTVKKAINTKTREMVALKIYEKRKLPSEAMKNNILREIKILKSLNHPNVVKIIACINTEPSIIIVLEYLEGTSLKEYLNKEGSLSESAAMPIFKEIIKAITYCHSKGISHRDIKIDNVVITAKNEVKIIDFGFSIWAKENAKCKMFCGTPAYMAPEIIIGVEYYPFPADVWALGVMLYIILIGTLPFKCNYLFII